jgi:hypothetical protein
MMMLLSNKPEKVNLALIGPLVSRKRRRSSPSASASAYTFDTDAEEEARDAALPAIASLASSVDDARRRLEADASARSGRAVPGGGAHARRGASRLFCVW